MAGLLTYSLLKRLPIWCYQKVA